MVFVMLFYMSLETLSNNIKCAILAPMITQQVRLLNWQTQFLKKYSNKNKKTVSNNLRLFLSLGILQANKRIINSHDDIDTIHFKARVLSERT